MERKYKLWNGMFENFDGGMMCLVIRQSDRLFESEFNHFEAPADSSFEPP